MSKYNSPVKESHDEESYWEGFYPECDECKYFDNQSMECERGGRNSCIYHKRTPNLKDKEC